MLCEWDVWTEEAQQTFAVKHVAWLHELLQMTSGRPPVPDPVVDDKDESEFESDNPVPILHYLGVVIGWVHTSICKKSKICKIPSTPNTAKKFGDFFLQNIQKNVQIG